MLKAAWRALPGAECSGCCNRERVRTVALCGSGGLPRFGVHEGIQRRSVAEPDPALSQSGWLRVHGDAVVLCSVALSTGLSAPTFSSCAESDWGASAARWWVASDLFSSTLVLARARAKYPPTVSDHVYRGVRPGAVAWDSGREGACSGVGRKLIIEKASSGLMCDGEEGLEVWGFVFLVDDRRVWLPESGVFEHGF